MKRFIFSVDSGQPKLITADEQKAIAASYASLDPSLRYLRTIHWTLDSDDIDDINLIEQNNYKDPNSALAKKFMGCATATAAGLAGIFAQPGFVILYVCIEISEGSYTLSVLQDTHPRAISGNKGLAPALRISPQKVTVAIKNVLASTVQPLKVRLASQKAQAVAALPNSSTGLDV
jgi:hypothetical protein